MHDQLMNQQINYFSKTFFFFRWSLPKKIQVWSKECKYQKSGFKNEATTIFILDRQGQVLSPLPNF